jgi:hypothetical protein
MVPPEHRHATLRRKTAIGGRIRSFLFGDEPSMLCGCPESASIAAPKVAGAQWLARCRTTFTPTPGPPPRIGRPLKLAPETWTVADDWPERLPVTQAEIDLFEAWFGDVFDELFGPPR